ncbi:AAA family ATPase [Candidatus Saccharibacteria bacterium]|nr:AAA family ATPase [Candidatus Saccharibacteria bacterium]
MMRFTKFHIENYKGIDSVDVVLDAYEGGNVLTLVGLNESGKTTVLDGIYFFQRDELPESKRFQLIPKKYGHNFSGDILTSASMVLDDEDEKKIKKFAAEQAYFRINPAYKIKEIVISKRYHFKASTYTGSSFSYGFKIVGQALRAKDKKFQTLSLTDQKYEKIGNYIHKNLCPTMIYYQNFLFDFPLKIYLESFAKEPKGQDIYRQVVQDILHSIDETLDLKENVLKRLQTGTDESKSALNQTINLMGNAITTEIIDSWGDIFDDDWQGKEISIVDGIDQIEEEVEVSPAVPASGDTPATPAKKEVRNRPVHYLQFKLKDGTNLFEIAERSLGFKWFFAFLLFTKFRLSRMTDPGETLFLLDEPASNLHSTAQQKLTHVFEKLTSQKNPAKLIFSTHSHHLVRSEWLETASIVQNTAIDYEQSGMSADKKDTKVKLTSYKRFVAAHPNQTSYFQPILDSLDYKPSELELVPNIVIVEGKHDFYTFKYMNEIMGIGKNAPNLYPGNGCGQNDRVIRLYEAWGKNYLVLLDSDPAGKSAIKKYAQEIGDFVDGKIYGLQDVSASFKGVETEKLFSDTDALLVIKTLDPQAKQFSKAKFNEAIKNLLFQKKKIKLSKTTTNRFEKIYKFLAEKIK